MTYNSDYHDYDIPDLDQRNWGPDVQSAFEAIDTDVEIRDEDANKSDYDPRNNAKFFGTDTHKVYLGDGSSWNEVADFTNIGSGSGSGAAEDATYVTIADESADLTNSEQHNSLSGSDLHDPANHGNEAHVSTFAVDGDAQPPESHDNTAHSTNYAVANHDNAEHSEAFVSDGDGTEREIWVIENGASDPAGAAAEDIIFEKEA